MAIGIDARKVKGGALVPMYLVDEDGCDVANTINTINVTVGTINTNVNTINDNTKISENHIHNFERWFGATVGVAPATPNIASRYRLTTSSSADAFGTAVLMINGTETLGKVFQTHFDFHRIHITDVESNGLIYKLRFIFNLNGEANAAAAVTNGHYTETCLKVDQTNADSMPIPIMSGRVPIGTKVWGQIAQAVAGAKYLDLLIGLHLYPSRPV